MSSFVELTGFFCCELFILLNWLTVLKCIMTKWLVEFGTYRLTTYFIMLRGWYLVAVLDILCPVQTFVIYCFRSLSNSNQRLGFNNTFILYAYSHKQGEIGSILVWNLWLKENFCVVAALGWGWEYCRKTNDIKKL